jgi:hypothetical protein
MRVSRLANPAHPKPGRSVSRTGEEPASLAWVPSSYRLSTPPRPASVYRRSDDLYDYRGIGLDM